MNYKTIITQAGQTVADLALQAYGNVSIEAMNALVEDNPAVFPNGIATLVPAGVPVKVREDAPFANKQIQGYFSGQELNSTYETGKADFEIPDEGEINNPPNLIQIVVGRRNQWRIELHIAWKEKSQTFGGSIVVLANGETAEAAIMTDVMDGVDFEPRIATEIGARYDEDNIILMLNTEDVSALKYRIVSAV